MATSKLSPRVLDREKLRVIKLQAQLVRDGGFFLAGGTGLGLRFGHRVSQDLDWFTAKRFSAKELQKRLEQLAEKPSKVERAPPALGAVGVRRIGARQSRIRGLRAAVEAALDEA